MTQPAAGLAVRQTVTVEAPPERAFAVFTEGLDSWWPLATHAIGAQPAVAVVVEPRPGGRWYERAADGSECDWGRVLAWEPPHRLVLAWEISADWQHDPGLVTEVEVRFHAEDADRTRVELEHRGLEAYADRAGDMRDTFDSPGGWPGLLERFAGAAAQGGR
ncbi:MAG TPA: SRPBCC family protein [Solirubrobacteraceae bacterium]|jgi:uncharacterized protein YndB with AHSA1/START domain|nr:SRPBCC family protein [Solirubrobacteraceae bacterium]